MSNFSHFLCWTVSVFLAALAMCAIKGLGIHLFSQSEINSVLVVLCVSCIIGSFLSLCIISFWSRFYSRSRLRSQQVFKELSHPK